MPLKNQALKIIIDFAFWSEICGLLIRTIAICSHTFDL